MSHFVYKLVPPRATFDKDMSEAEAGVMAQHAAYWMELLQQRRVLVFGPVSDPAGVWGLAVVDTNTYDDARALAVDDPAVTAGVCTFELHPLAAVLPTDVAQP